MTGKSALLIGATGAVGKHLLSELVASPSFSRVGEYGRRVTSSLANTAPGKLEQGIIDFDDPAALKDALAPGKWDVVFVTLGTTRALAGGAAQFEKIDREYVVRACEAARTTDPGHVQRVVYLSSAGANHASLFLYPKSKGLTERALAHLGYADTIVFRPGFLRGAQRAETRVAESIAGVITGAIAHVGASVEIEVSLLAKAMAKAGTLGSSNIPADVGATTVDAGDGASFTVLSNKAASLLGRSTE